MSESWSPPFFLRLLTGQVELVDMDDGVTAVENDVESRNSLKGRVFFLCVDSQW